MIERPAACQNPTPDASTTTINRLVAENTNLRRKLQTQPVIEQAKGILMATHGVSADEAFEMLSKWSQDAHTQAAPWSPYPSPPTGAKATSPAP